MSKDEYYATTAARLDTIIGGDQRHLTQLIRAREEFTGAVKQGEMIQWENFYSWLQDKYGVRMAMTEGGMLTLDYEVIDERKHMIFVLKFSGDA